MLFIATKAQIAKVVAEKTDEEKKRILEVMVSADIYTLTLDPLIETYLDTYKIYTTMYLRWESKGFPETQKHTNKSGATNNSKHPLAQQVEVWNDKKLRVLEKLGLTNRALQTTKILGKNSMANEEMIKPEEVVKDDLQAHRSRWRKGVGE